MTSIFDGMAGALNGVFGAPVLYLPRRGISRNVQSMFREEPVRVSDPDGAEIVTIMPLWRVPATLACDIARGDEIMPGNGKRYVIVNRQASGSPASDAFVVFELELVT